ncbi:MAG TPA: VCBS repeat-containing protein [Acidobacteriaceae bacterium]|jgi:hypothetical protein|nr:VCBS repeat-containing protein [Acidobacteriaceae bacterium]
MRRLILLPVLFLSAAPAQQDTRLQHAGAGVNGAARESSFLVHRLGNDHAEGITTLDMNGDGFLDLVSGAYWYENPGAQGGEWKRHQWRTVSMAGEFVSDCGEWTVDVNHDGAPDVVTAGWITNGAWWYENPKQPGVMWKRHLIADSFDTEGGVFADINGDGKPDLALAHYNHSGILWVDFSGSAPRVHHLLPTAADGHGVGVADIDGDGKADILTPFGWFRQINADADQWEWHPDWNIGDTGFPIIGYDVNGDGRTDLIVGQGHGYGLYWWEQGGPKAHPTWTKHIIDESFSQSHALLLTKIDGEMQLITGKRYRGHSGNDPGSYDPVVVYAYTIDQKTATFTRHTLSINGTASAGTQFIAADLDQDGDIDLASAGKLGVHIFENLRVDHVSKAVREQQIPLERAWPFEGEGHMVQQENGPQDLVKNNNEDKQ